MNHPLRRDLDHILCHTESLWRELSGARIFYTGGTGFFGVWILESMVWAQKHIGVHFQVTLLSRNPRSFLERHPQFQDQSFLEFYQGDITQFIFPDGSYSHVLHGATTSAHATFFKEKPLPKFNNVAEGTRRTLEFAHERGIPHFWLMSSGSAYGKQPPEQPLMLEDYLGGPDTLDPNSALGHGKRAAEFLCSAYSQMFSMECKVARCFSFVGPYLPLDIHYAIGNFIADGLSGRPIHVRGTGTPIRSYLYMSDLVIWLMTIFLKGKTLRTYNVGSEDGRSVREIAHTVAKCFSPEAAVEISKDPIAAPPTAASDVYVPSTHRAKTELGLEQWISLDESIRRTIEFYRVHS